MSKMDEAVSDLGVAYNAWKSTEVVKNEAKDDFFKLADEALVGQGLATKVATYPGEHAEAREKAIRHNPGWNVDESRETFVDGEKSTQFVLIEEPSLKAFSHDHEGMRYSRQVSRGPAMIDDEWLKEEEPDLYEQVTYALPWGERIVIPPEHLPSGLLPLLSKYIYNAKPRVSLAAPRPLKED